jgi:CheY-like chemotaxis protein
MTTLKIAVQDSGVGMDQDNLDMIFSAFSQVDDSTTRLHDGIGLGLIIVKKLTDMLSGKINTHSELGAGSLFEVRIPCKFASTEKVSQPSENLLHAQCEPLPIRILVVEEHAVNQKIITRLVQSFGASYALAENGKDALEKLEKYHFDLVLMDCQMHVMDCYTATRQLRRSSWPQRDIPVIAITANAMIGDRERCLKAGMSNYLSKPIAKSKLYSVIHKWTTETALAPLKHQPGQS